ARAAAMGAEVDALERFPTDEHAPVARVLDVDAAVVVVDVVGTGKHDAAAVGERHRRAAVRVALDGADGAHAHLVIVALLVLAVELVARHALVLVPLDVAAELAVARLYLAPQPRLGAGDARGRRPELDRADAMPRHLDLAEAPVPHLHLALDVVAAALDVEDGAVLERHPHLVAALRLETDDVAEAGDELAVLVPVAVEGAELDAEELDLVAVVAAGEARRVVEPGVLFLRAVEEVAPEGLLVVPAQAAFVGLAVAGGQAAVEEALVAGGGGKRQRPPCEEQGGKGPACNRAHRRRSPRVAAVSALETAASGKSFRAAGRGPRGGANEAATGARWSRSRDLPLRRVSRCGASLV